MVKKSTGNELDNLCKGIIRSFANWENLRQYGGSDPFWPDGANMNLERNHIIYYKREIEAYCKANGVDFPAEYFTPTPSKVNQGYMANLEQKERVKRLRQQGDRITTRRPPGIPEQQSML